MHGIIVSILTARKVILIGANDFIWITNRRLMSLEYSRQEDKDPVVVLALGFEFCNYGEPAY